MLNVLATNRCPVHHTSAGSAEKQADLCALCLLAGHKILGFMTFIKYYAAIIAGPATPIHHLLQPPLTLDMRYECCVCPAGKATVCKEHWQAQRVAIAALAIQLHP